MVEPFVILGTHWYAEEIYDLSTETPSCRVEAFVENLDPSRCQGTLEGLPIVWIDRLAEFVATHRAVCALTTTHRDRFVEQAAVLGMPFGRLIHPSSQVSRRAELSEGVIINRGVQIATRATLGRHVVVSRGALVGHHTTLEDFVTVQPGANIAGGVRIGAGTYVGMGAIILDRLTVGKGSVIGAGAVVTRDVPDAVQVVGVPAKVVRENIPGK